MSDIISTPQAETPSSRRNLLLTGATLVAGAAMAMTPVLAAEMKGPSKATLADIDILNFALSLEHLEAAFYAQVLGAQQTRAYLINDLLPLAKELAVEEASHVKALQQTITSLGGTPVAAKTYKFPTNAFISPVGFAWFGYTLEEIGIGAYLGSIGKLSSTNLRATAASIYGAESRHAGILRSSGGFNFAPRYFESPYTKEQVQALIAPYGG